MLSSDPTPLTAIEMRPVRDGFPSTFLACVFALHGRQSADPAKKRLKHADDLFSKPLPRGDETVACLRQPKNTQSFEGFT